MHEWLITRGEVQGAPFEDRIQIYNSMNCVVLHEGECHRRAQWENVGMIDCFREVAKYNYVSHIALWVKGMTELFVIAEDKIRWLQNHGKLLT